MNSNTYTRIGRDDFEHFLGENFGAFENVQVRNTRELVYDLPVEGTEDFVVRVFSSLTTEGQGRDAGADAIKCIVWDVAAERPRASATRTHRIQTWAKNLAPKVADLLAQAEDMAASRSGEDDEAIAAVENLPVASGAKGEVVVSDLSRDDFGRVRLHLTGDTYAAKDAIKFDWAQTHHAFDGDTKAWMVDADATEALAASLAEDGFTLVQADLSAPEEADVVAEATEAAEMGQGLLVTYTAKNSRNTLTVEGDVTTARNGRIMFRRAKDGHTMLVTDEGLFTTGSHYPFVGEVQGIELY